MSVADGVAESVAQDVAQSVVGQGEIGATFAIADLFTGSDGLWYDLSDTSTLFQDAAGTTPVTANSDPIGLITDKSGFSNNATQSTAGARPVWSSDGHMAFNSANSSELVLDGTVQNFITKAADFSIGLKFYATDATATYCLVNVSTSSTDRVVMLAGSATRNVAVGLYTGAYNGKVKTAGLPANEWVHLGLRFVQSTSTVTLFINGVDDSDGTSLTNAGTNDSIGLTNNGTIRLTGNMRNVVMLDYALSDANFAELASAS